MDITDNYASLYSNLVFANHDPGPFLAMFFLFIARMFPILTQAPFFGAKILPHPVKVVFGICLFVIFLPQMAVITKSHLVYDFHLILLFVKELFVGFLLGYFISIPFIIMQNTGVLIDHQRGASSLMVSDPSTQNQTSPLGTLFNMTLIYLFFYIDGPFKVIEIVYTSYEMIAPDQFMDMNFFNVNSKFVAEVTKLMGQVMILSTQMAAPALIIILMTDFFLGIANRLAPQVQITFLGMPLKSLLALMIVFFGWHLFVQQMVTESSQWINYINNLIRLFKPIPIIT